MGLFERPRRSTLPYLREAARGVRRVTNERELLSAIDDAYKTGRRVTEDAAAADGERWAAFDVVISGSVTISGRIDIPATLRGLHLTGEPGSVVLVGDTGADGFGQSVRVFGDDCSVANLRFVDNPNANSAVVSVVEVYGDRFSASNIVDDSGADETFSPGDSAHPAYSAIADMEVRDSLINGITVEYATVARLTVSNIVIRGGFLTLATPNSGTHTDFSADRVVLTGTAGINLRSVDGGVVRGCNLEGLLGLDVDSACSKIVITGNIIDDDIDTDADGTVIACNWVGDNITVAGSATDCVISSNAMNGGDITTTASGGSNTVVGNTNTGTISTHGTDSVANNT